MGTFEPFQLLPAMPSAIPAAVATAAAALAENPAARVGATGPAGALAYKTTRPAVLSLLTNLNAVLLSAGQVQTDVEDARDVLARAAALSMG